LTKISFPLPIVILMFKQFGFHSLGERVRALDPIGATATWQADYHASG
jgi:hypothetical protein